MFKVGFQIHAKLDLERIITSAVFLHRFVSRDRIAV